MSKVSGYREGVPVFWIPRWNPDLAIKCQFCFKLPAVNNHHVTYRYPLLKLMVCAECHRKLEKVNIKKANDLGKKRIDLSDEERLQAILEFL